MNDLLGLGLKEVPSDFLKKWELYFSHAKEFNPYAPAVSAVSLLVIYSHERMAFFFDGFEEPQKLGNIDAALNHARKILGLPEVSRPAFSVPAVKREMQ